MGPVPRDPPRRLRPLVGRQCREVRPEGDVGQHRQRKGEVDAAHPCVRALQRAVESADAQRPRREPRRRAPDVVQQLRYGTAAVQVPVVEPGGTERRRLEGPRPLVVRLVELEGHIWMPRLHTADDGDEGVLVVGVVVRWAVHPRHEVELELAHVVVAHQPVDHAHDVALEGGIRGVPDAEAGVVGHLSRRVTDRRTRPVGMGGVGPRRAVELQR